MLHKYLSKFTIDILPSILATIVGAYIVNHYIIPKASPDRPAAAVASTPAEPKPDTKAATAKPAENSADLANLPESAPAKAGDKPVVEKASIEKPEAATTPEPRRHQPALREKAAAKPAPAPAAPAPVLATVGTAPAANASADERRDANDLARAAIERLNRSEPRPQEAARAPETPRAPEAPRVQEAARTVSLRRCSSCRRRSWWRRQASRSSIPCPRRPNAPKYVAFVRPVTSRRRSRWICRRMLLAHRDLSAPTWPKMCCLRQSRCSIR